MEDMRVIPYIAFESEMARNERDKKRLLGICVLLIFLLVFSNLGWFYYENQFEDTVITQENEDGYNNYIGDDGDITYGETDY